MTMRLSLLALALTGTALPALAQEVNVYSHRQPELIQPLVDAFTAETGIRSMWPSWTKAWPNACRPKATARPPTSC